MVMTKKVDETVNLTKQNIVKLDFVLRGKDSSMLKKYQRRSFSMEKPPDINSFDPVEKTRQKDDKVSFNHLFQSPDDKLNNLYI